MIFKIYLPQTNENNFFIDNVSLVLTPLESLPPTVAPIGLPDWVNITKESFESGWGNFTLRKKKKDDLNGDNKLSKAKSRSGSFSALIRDNSLSSKIGTNMINISNYTEVRVDFWFQTVSMEEGESFVLERRFNRRESWVLIGEWIMLDQGFSNREWIEESVTIQTNNGEEVQFRFRCLGSDNTDKVFIDDVVVTGVDFSGIGDRATSPPTMEPANLALNKPTNQSGVLHDGVSSIAVDGEKTKKLRYIHTRIRGWWVVDLQATASISHILIYNSDTKRSLNKAYVSVLDINKEVVAGHTIIDYRHDVIEIEFTENVEGRFVHISSWLYIKLIEVEVIGSIIPGTATDSVVLDF